MSAAWSAEQQRCLEALGYTLYRPAIPAPDAAAENAVTALDPLLRALLRAAGCNQVQGDADAWMRKQQIPPLARLRDDPSAKRALWPRLRASRREQAKP